MQTVILCGGLGSRLSEETENKPKPMVEISGKPILWHIMKIYSYYGLNDFIICLGYKGYQIKEYFSNFLMHNNDFTININDNSIKYHSNKEKNKWKITLVDTGRKTLTGGRLKRVGKFITKKDFCFTYGDGLSNVNIKKLISCEKYLTLKKNSYKQINQEKANKKEIYIYDYSFIKTKNQSSVNVISI